MPIASLRRLMLLCSLATLVTLPAASAPSAPTNRLLRQTMMVEASIGLPTIPQGHHAARSLHLVADESAAPSGKAFKRDEIVVETPWTRATPAGAQAAGGFLKITNTGRTIDRLVGGTFASASTVEVHEMALADGIMTMRELEQGLEINPGQTVELKPGSFHMMFIGLKQGLVAGGTVKGTLKFEKAGQLDVDYDVAPLGAKSFGGRSSQKHH